MENKLDLSLVMIAKNEAEKLPFAIKSLKDIVSQIIVVDTGSDDKTPQIASRLGAEVFFISWKDNFAFARNFALSHVRHSWVIFLDADEMFDPESIEELYNTFSFIESNPEKNIGGINMLITNSLGENAGAPSYQHRYTRIFRKHKDIYFIGRIHEQVRPSIEKLGFNVVDTDINIIHSGYKNNSIEKLERNRSLLEIELSENPNDNWLKFHLAETYFTLAKFDKAEKYFTECVDSISLSLEQSERAHIRLAQIALSKNNFEDLVQWLSFQSNNINIEGLRRFVLAAGLLHHKKLSAALDLYLSEEVQKSSYVDKEKLYEAIKVLKQVPGI